jgi:multisubunit Na+/H+ antiporter MnhE subunit
MARPSLVRRLRAAGVLLGRFAWALVLSGMQTAGVILRGGHGLPPAALIRMRFAPMSPAGASILGCLITLTPGTTTLDVDMASRELLLHVLDASDPQAVVDGIRQDFERHLVVLFGPAGEGRP